MISIYRPSDGYKDVDMTEAFFNTSSLPGKGWVVLSPPPPPPPTPEEIIEQLTQALEAYYDSIARSMRYDNRYTCALRAGYAGPFQAEGLAFATWMDACNAYGYQVIADVQNGLRGIPAAEELLAELPLFVWPT